jgi:predicted short-subunit dehydrogenase-like oxidoreductase (DUF2520 family)
VKTINVIGCGKVGKTLARLWAAHKAFEVQLILNRSLASGERAAEFVGGGRAIESCSQLERADAVMISACDESIEDCCRELCRAGVVDEGVIVFHCSGSLTSTLLQRARGCGALIASVHPVKSFADPAKAAETFAGTFCALEGDPEACEALGRALRRCGAKTFHVRPDAKTVYHAATVFVCNYLVALMDIGLRCFERAGIPRDSAAELMQPIVAGTVDNVFTYGTVRALTGPIARGDVSAVARHCEAFADRDEDVRRLYKQLGLAAIELSAAQGNASPQALAAIRQLLQR